MEEVVNKYEKCIKTIIFKAERPTAESIEEIETKIGIKLPSDLIKFASLSPNYGNWLASIGPDYNSITHIININSRLKDEGKIPSNFVAFNVGYDDDWDCMDLDTYDHNTGEYLITHWSADTSLSDSNLSGSFKEYICNQISFWQKDS